MSTIGPDAGAAARGVAVVVVRAGGRHAALVDERDDRLHALLVEDLGVLVDGLDLVVELQALDAVGGDDVGGALKGHADEPDLHAVVLPHPVGGEDRLAGLLVRHVRGEVGVVGALELLAVLETAVLGVTAAVLHARQLRGALVELVVADARDVEVELVHRLDGGLVVEEPRQQRAGPDQVAGRGGDAVRVALPGGPQGRGEVLDAARVDLPRGAVRQVLRDLARRAGRGLQVAVEVVEGEQLHVDRAAALAPVVPVLRGVRGQRRDERADGGEPGGRGEYPRRDAASGPVRCQRSHGYVPLCGCCETEVPAVCRDQVGSLGSTRVARQVFAGYELIAITRQQARRGPVAVPSCP